MDQTGSVPENVKVILRVRPRIDALPAHPQYQSSVNSGIHDPDCVCLIGGHQVKLLPPTHCRCDACFNKAFVLNNVAEKFGSTGGRDKKEKFFNFETIFGPESSQEDIFSAVVDTAYSSVLGFNATIFAYGSAGSGKTYTMTGTKSQPGVIPRVIDDVFRNIQHARAQSRDIMFHVEMSYIEMYNNGFRNLLRQLSDELGRVEAINGNSDMILSELDELLQIGVSEAAFEAGVSRFVDLSHKLDKITVHESVATGVYLCGPNIRIPVKSASAALRLFAIGNKQRSETMKKSNDRSHAVVTLHVESKVSVRDGASPHMDDPERTAPFQEKKSGRDTPSIPAVRSELRLGKIHLVDLAGSERLSETKAEGETMTETQNINKSLLALGEVLHALALNASIQSKNVRKRSIGGDEAGRPRGISFASESPGAGEMHVPYFNSKLTHLLKDSLGGNSKTVMIANVGCEVEQYHHILQSLNYATRAMKVRNFVHPNRVEIGESDVIPDLSNERDIINQLKERYLNRGPNGRERPVPRFPSAGKIQPPQPPAASSSGSIRGPSPQRVGSNGSVASQPTVSSRRARSASPQVSASPARPNRLPPGSKAYTLKLNDIQAHELNYVSFPLCPVLKFKVDRQSASTSKNLYVRSVATFPESFEFEVGVLKYKSGVDLEVEAVNVSPLTGEMVPIGAGKVDVQSILPALNAEQAVTIDLINDMQQPAGIISIGAILLDRPVGSAVSYPTPARPTAFGAQTPFSPSGMGPSSQLEFDPRRRSDDLMKNAVFRVDRIVCHDLTLPSAATAAKPEHPKSDLYVVVQVGNDSLRTDAMPGKKKQNNIFAVFERPCMVFDVDYDQLPSETLHVSVFEVPPGPNKTKQCVGRAKAPLFSLIGRNDGVYTPASEFAMQLKDEQNDPVGKVSLFLLFSKNDAPLQLETRALFESPSKGAMTSPTKHLRSLGMSPRLYNVRMPSTFSTGWIRISAITATNLNKFRLVGNTARYKHLREAPNTPVPAYLKHSELFGKQDPFVVVEAGDFWGSYSKVLLNQGWNCQWDQAAFCCYLSQVEATDHNLRVSVYDRSCSGYHNVFIGNASVPLINLFADQRTAESTLELSVVDRRGKANGKLELKYTWEASDEKERWSNGIVTRVCGDGCYDVRYDDGEEEFAVNKDVIRLLSRSKATPSHKGRRFEFGGDLFQMAEGSRVEVNDQGRGLWFPAVVVRNNHDGSYDLRSDYDIITSAVSADNIRTLDGESPSGPVRMDLSRRLNFDGSVNSVGNPMAKFKVRDLVEGNYKSKGTWYAGRIVKVHSYELYCTYDIDYLTGEYECEVAEDMIRLESTRYAPEDAATAYELRQLRAQRAESNVEIPLQRAIAAAKARADAERTKSKFQVGQAVEVNYRGHGRFLLGTVQADYENGLYDVVYESGEQDIDVSEDLIRSPEAGADGADPAKKLQQAEAQSRMYKFQVGDRVEANYREIGKYIPGIITRDRGHGVFDVHYYDGRDETKVHFDHIRMADPNALFAPAKRDAKYKVADSVECNCERLGVWYHALIRNVLDTGLYNIQYDDGETEYDVEEDMLRAGGAYSPGIPSLKPFFKVGDRVKVACRSPEVEHELRSLSAIKQRIMEERKKLAESKLVVAKRGAVQEAVNEAVAKALRGLQGFKTRVGYSGDISCCQAEKNDGSGTSSDAQSTTGVSPTSFKKLDEIAKAFNNPPTAAGAGAGAAEADADPIETLNDAITKAIVVEQSLAHLARAAKEEELAKAHSAYLLSVIEKEKADELALARAIDEAKARKRNNFSREEELKAFREAYLKAELELGHIMAARQLVLEQDEALKIAKQKSDFEAKCIMGAQRKGERAAERLKEEDRQRLVAGEQPAGKGGRHATTGKHAQASRKQDSPSYRVQKALGPDVAAERDALRRALVRVKDSDDQLKQAKARAEQAGREYAAADAQAQSAQTELQMVIDNNRQMEHNLTEDSTASTEFQEYLSASEAIAAYNGQANAKNAQKMVDVRKAETSTAMRMRKEEAAAVSAEKRIFAEESMVRAARAGEMEDAKCAMREANAYGEQQGDDIEDAIAAADNETDALIRAKAYAEEERKMYASARDIAVLAAGLLRVIIADQREREYGALEEKKELARRLAAELQTLQEIIAERDLRRVNTTAAAQTENLAITQFRTRASTVRITTTTTTSTTMSTIEKTTLSLKILKAQSGRESAEEEIQRLSQERMVVEERARVASTKCEIEESAAVACAQDDAARDAPLDRFNDAFKREQLHHFSTYSHEECKAVRTATLHAEDHCEALREAKARALAQIEAIDACRECVQEEFSALSSLSVVERDELRPLVELASLPELQKDLAAAKVRAIDASRDLFHIKQKATERMKELLASKESTNDVLEELAKAQAITQSISPRDFSVDRTKVSIVEGAQLAVRDALAQAVEAEKARLAAEANAQAAQRNAADAVHRAAGSERLRSREEEMTHQAMLANDGIGMDDEEQRLALTAAVTHTEAQIAALLDAATLVEQEIEDLIAARAHSEAEGRAIQLALAKEEVILLAKAQWEQQKADAELTVAKKLLDGRATILHDAQNNVERHVLALDVMISTLERAAKELVARGDDDIDEYRAYQKEFKRLECKKQKAAEHRTKKENKKSKAEVAHAARGGEEESAVAPEDRIYQLERDAAMAEQRGDPTAEIKALREARRLCNESTNALSAAKEYAVAEEELLQEAQDEAEEERKALSLARDHAEESWRLLAKALSVLPLKHRTPMGLMLLNGGDGFFKGVPVKPRKDMGDKDDRGRYVDPGRLNLLDTDMDDVAGNKVQRAADFRDDNSLPDKDSKDMAFQFEANPLKAALRASMDDLDRAHEFLDAAKGRTDDAEQKYRIANAAATAEGDAVAAQEEDNAALSRRLYDNFVGVEAEYAQLQKVRSDLSYEDKCTSNLRAAKEAEVKKVKPFAQNRLRCEDLAAGFADDRAKAIAAVQDAAQRKDKPALDKALVDAKKKCDQEAAALNEAAQSAAKECTAWGNGTAAANKERGSAEKAHALADEEARLLALIRAAQLSQGKEMYRAACFEAEHAKEDYDETYRGMDGFADLVEELKAGNAQREAELDETTKGMPAYRAYKDVRAKFEAENKRAAAAHTQHDQEVAKAMAARQEKDEAGQEAEDLEERRLEAEAAADEAHAAKNKEEEEHLSDQAKQLESGVGSAYQHGTQSANVETAAWRAAALHLEAEKEALTAAHGVSLDATAMLIDLRNDQIARELAALGDAKQLALECSNVYDAANKRAAQAAAALERARALLHARETLLGDDVEKGPDYAAYLDHVEAANSADEQANEFQQEKLTERAAVDVAIAAKLQDEKVALAAGTQRAVAAAALKEAQSTDNMDAELHAMEDLKKFSDDEEAAITSATANVQKEAHLWTVATEFANEETAARIVAKDHTNEAIRLLNALRLEKEYAELEAKKAEVVESQRAYQEVRKAVMEAKAKTPQLVECAKMPAEGVSPDAQNSPEYDRYVHRSNAVLADANRPVIDFDIINAAELARAKAAGQSRVKEEQAAAKAVETRNATERVAADMKAAAELEQESKAVEDSNTHVDSEERSVIAATQFAKDELAVWRNLKQLSENELKAANNLNDRAEEAAKMLRELMLSEKGRLAEAAAAAVEGAAEVENEYYATNKKTIARSATLQTNIARTQALAKTLHEDCQETPEYLLYQSLLPKHEPLDAEAQAIKREKEELVAAAEVMKARRTSLDQACSPVKPVARGTSVRELAAKFEKVETNVTKRAALYAESSIETLNSLLLAANEETEAWKKATAATIREKAYYTSSNALFEEALLLEAASTCNLRERNILSALNAAEEGANKAKAEFYAQCEANDLVEEQLTGLLDTKDTVQANVQVTDPAILTSAAFVRVQDKFDKENARAISAAEAKEEVVKKATALIDARLAEETSAAESAHQYRRVVPGAIATKGRSPAPSAALPRLDKTIAAVQPKPKAGAADDVADEPATPYPTDFSDGADVDWKLLRAVFCDFGNAKRDASASEVNMQALAAERVAAETEETSLDKATQYAVEEERTWRLALEYTKTQADALAKACQAADEAAKVLAGMKDDIDAQERAALEGSCADATAGSEKFAKLNGECVDLGKVFDEKKATIAAKDAEINAESKETVDYQKFTVLNGQLQKTDEPAILAARSAKEAAAQRAEELRARKDTELANMTSASRARREADMKKARASAQEAAAGEAAAWDEANKHATTEASLLRPGIAKEDEAIKLLQNVKADQLKRENDALGAAQAAAEGERDRYGAAFGDAERKHATYAQEKDTMNGLAEDIAPETKSTPTYRKFEKLKAELDDEDDPFIFSKRDARVSAAAKAQEVVVANQRRPPSVEASEEERDAWAAAAELAEQEVGGLDVGIDKAKQAQDLLSQAKLEELQKQGDENQGGLDDAKRRAAEAAQALKDLEARIAETRTGLSKLQDNNQKNAESIRGKGPEFAADYAAYQRTLESINSAVTSAESHRVKKVDRVEKATAANKSAAKAEEDFTRGAPLQDPSAEAQRRRDAVVEANTQAQAECEHLEEATTEARSELSELQKAKAAAAEVGDRLEDASSSRAYRTRMGYLLMGGDEDLIPIPKGKPFAGIPSAPARKRFIEASKLKKPVVGHYDDDEIKLPQRRKAECEIAADEYPNDSRDPKVLFEVGGGWAEAVAAQVKKYMPYEAPEADEFMPERAMKKEVPTARVRVRRGSNQVTPSLGFFAKDEHGEVTQSRLRGKALLKAVVKHLIQLNRVVKSLKPLAEGELQQIQSRIVVSEQALEDTSHFLVDNTLLQSRAGKQLQRADREGGDSGDATEDEEEHANVADVSAISSNITNFLTDLQRKDELIEQESSTLRSSTTVTTTKKGLGFASVAKAVVATNKLKNNVRVPQTAGADVTQFKERKQVDLNSISSLLFGGLTSSVDVAVLEEEEDVVETVKETKKDTVRLTEKSELHSTDETHTEETEVVQTSTTIAGYGAQRVTNGSATASNKGSSSSAAKSASSTSQKGGPSAPSGPVAMNLSAEDGFDDFGAYEEHYDPSQDAADREASLGTAVDSLPSPVGGSSSKTSGGKKVKKVGSSSSVTSGGSRSGNSTRRKPDSEIMAEMMSGNVDI